MHWPAAADREVHAITPYLALQIPYSLSSPEGIICVKGLARFAPAIGEMEEFPYGCTNHHHLRLAALTQTLPKGTEE